MSSLPAYAPSTGSEASRTFTSSPSSLPLFQYPLSNTCWPTHSILKRHQSLSRGGAHPLVSIAHHFLPPALFKPCESMTVWRMVAKKVTSLSQGTVHLRVKRDAGCLEIVARNVRTMVIYGLSVDLAKGKDFCVGLFRTWDSMVNVSWAANLNEVEYLLA